MRVREQLLEGELAHRGRERVHDGAAAVDEAAARGDVVVDVRWPALDEVTHEALLVVVDGVLVGAVQQERLRVRRVDRLFPADERQPVELGEGPNLRFVDRAPLGVAEHGDLGEAPLGVSLDVVAREPLEQTHPFAADRCLRLCIAHDLEVRLVHLVCAADGMCGGSARA